MRIAIAAVVLTVSPAWADAIETCKHAASLAGKVMEARQNGATIKDVIGPILDSTPKESKRLMQSIVMGAFEQPRYTTPINQRNAVADYENDTFVSCMDAF